MICPKCKFIEMRIDSVNNNEVKHCCKKCGNEIITKVQEESTDENQI